MVQGYRLDPDGKVADERFAVVYAPKRDRDREPEGNVQVVETEAVARAADPVKKLFPARVTGPARSSTACSRQLLPALLYLPTSLWVADAVYLVHPWTRPKGFVSTILFAGWMVGRSNAK